MLDWRERSGRGQDRPGRIFMEVGSRVRRLLLFGEIERSGLFMSCCVEMLTPGSRWPELGSCRLEVGLFSAESVSEDFGFCSGDLFGLDEGLR